MSKRKPNDYGDTNPLKKRKYSINVEHNYSRSVKEIVRPDSTPQVPIGKASQYTAVQNIAVEIFS